MRVQRVNTVTLYLSMSSWRLPSFHPVMSVFTASSEPLRGCGNPYGKPSR